MHDFRAYILPKLPPPQRGLSAIAELLVTFPVLQYGYLQIFRQTLHFCVSRIVLECAAWNTLPSDLHDITDTSTFRKRLKNVLFDRAYN